MSALDFFSLGALLFAARAADEKAAYIWMQIFCAITMLILIGSWIKGGAA
jgi:hypothetical protein